MKLGLLHEVGKKKAIARKQPAYLSYEHKSLQDFGASKFVTERLETAENMKETLKELFPSWEAVQRYREVIIFAAGQMKDSRPLVQHVYEMQVEDYLNEMRTGDHPSIDDDLFESLNAESSIRLFDHPLHNKYINYYDHLRDEDKKRPSDTAPVYFPSQVYHFYEMKHGVVLENHVIQEEEIPPCAMFIHYPYEAVSDSLLSICSQISTHQHVTDLSMEEVTCNSITPPRLTEPVRVYLLGCNFPEVFMQILLHQLIECHCGESLQELQLSYMNLKHFESLLDELLEDLAAHHEAGLAQRELLLRLTGGIFQPTNLSEEFVEKWRNRCKKVDSIHCRIYGDDYQSKRSAPSKQSASSYTGRSYPTEGGKSILSLGKEQQGSSTADHDVKDLKTLSTAVLQSEGLKVKYAYPLDSGKGRLAGTENEAKGIQLYPMMLYKNCKQYYATVANGNASTMRSPDSEITLEVAKGLTAIIMQHIHTDFETVCMSIPCHECLVSPVVRFIIQNGKHRESEEFIFKAKIPHCLSEGYDFSLLKVRLGNLSKEGSLKEVQRGKPQSTNTPFYTADEKYITLYTNHFCDVVCSSTKKICDSSLVILPFGKLYRVIDENQTKVKVKVFLCNYLFNKPDVRMGWEKDQNRRGLELLEIVNIFPRVEDFDPYKSQVTLSLEPTAGEWNSLIDTEKTRKLLDVVDISDGHFCKSSIVKDAATFDLTNSKLKTSFHARLDITLHAARFPKSDQPEAVKQEAVNKTEDICEEFEISIPPMETKGTTLQTDGRKPSEQTKEELNTDKLLKLSRHINSEEGLTRLAIIGLGLTDSDVDRHIKNKIEFTMAVYSLLKEWSNKIENPADAYQILYEALGKDGVDMKNHREVLK